jgi:hypothetical protein
MFCLREYFRYVQIIDVLILRGSVFVFLFRQILCYLEQVSREWILFEGLLKLNWFLYLCTDCFQIITDLLKN